MPLYYKKVDALQLVLTDEQKEKIRTGAKLEFDRGTIKYMGGNNYAAIMRSGDTFVKIEETQWLVKHPDGNLQILWPHEFEANFVKPKETASITV